MAERYKLVLKDDSLLTGLTTSQRRKLAEKSTDPEILKELSKSKDDTTLVKVAFNKNCPSDILEKLAEDESKDVRGVVSRNPNTPIEVLKKLAKDKYHWARVGVAENPSTPVEILRELAEDEDADFAVAENPNTPVDIIVKVINKLVEKGYNKTGISVAKTAKDPELLKKLSKNKDEDIRTEVAYNINTPADVLEKLSKDKATYWIRVGVAQNPNTPVDILRKLAGDESGNVRYWTVKNKNTPVDAVRELAEDEDSDVRKAVKSNLNNRSKNTDLGSMTTSQIRNTLFKGSKDNKINALNYILDNLNKFDKNILKLVVQLDIPYLDDVLRNNSNTPDDILDMID